MAFQKYKAVCEPSSAQKILTSAHVADIVLGGFGWYMYLLPVV